MKAALTTQAKKLVDMVRRNLPSSAVETINESHTTLGLAQSGQATFPPTTQATQGARQRRRETGRMRTLKSQVKGLQRRCKKLNSQKQSLEAKLLLLEGECSTAKDINASQQKTIQMLKVDLFRLQPNSEPPDTEYRKLCDSLCIKVSNWIVDEMNRFEDTGQLMNDQLMRGVLGHVLKSKVFERDTLRAWEYWLIPLVHTVLQQRLFSPYILLFGLPRYMISAFQTVEEGFRATEETCGKLCLGKESDPADFYVVAEGTIFKWQVNTLKVLAKTLQVQQARENQKRSLATAIWTELLEYCPDFEWNSQAMRVLESEVLDTALELELMIRTSHSRLGFNFSERVEPPTLITDQSMKHAVFIDVDTRKKLTPRSITMPDTQGRLGALIHQVEPKLYRVENDSVLSIRPGHHLLKLANPLKQIKKEN